MTPKGAVMQYGRLF